MSRVIITPRAARDLEDVGDIIAAEHPSAAVKLIERLKTTELLSRNPRIGVLRNDIAVDVRVFPVGKYLIIFRSLTDGVEIVRYVHGARQLKSIDLML